MADIFGRRAALLAAIAIVIVASAICTGAPTNAFAVLILGRGIQGVGAAGINVVVRVILGDGVSLKEYSRNFSTFSYFGGIGYGIGPAAGGDFNSFTFLFAFSCTCDCLLVVELVCLHERWAANTGGLGYLAQINWRWLEAPFFLINFLLFRICCPWFFAAFLY